MKFIKKYPNLGKIVYNYSIKDDMKQDLKTEIEKTFKEPEIESKCPICREQVYTVGRCKTCLSCGWSICEG
jgi:hypothetical protein